ncbi:hypothetical protein WME98_19685 [Sorangium sp. So ce296]|uniref:hypothetical protein n=1 Tax=Sorangium sp. So ce296 TaxID=3133296 RepID=UPI003F6054F8
MTIDAEIARWCSRPIDAGHPGLKLTPLVLGPAGVPVVTDLEARGLEIPAEVRERVLASTDLAELDRWIRRAAAVSDARELLATSGS